MGSRRAGSGLKGITNLLLRDLRPLRFGAPVTHVYNPLLYARVPYDRYLGRYGKGKVALFTLSPTGKEAPGEIAWWNWNGWFPLVRNVFSWLSD